MDVDLNKPCIPIVVHCDELPALRKLVWRSGLVIEDMCSATSIGKQYLLQAYGDSLLAGRGQPHQDLSWMGGTDE